MSEGVAQEPPSTLPYDAAFPNEGHLDTGLNKREYFAGQALAGLMSLNLNGELAAIHAVAAADHLISLLNKSRPASDE